MSPAPAPTLRPSKLADLETHVAHRIAMFRDMEMGSEEGLKRMAEAFRGSFDRINLSTGEGGPLLAFPLVTIGAGCARR